MGDITGEATVHIINLPTQITTTAGWMWIPSTQRMNTRPHQRVNTTKSSLCSSITSLQISIINPYHNIRKINIKICIKTNTRHPLSSTQDSISDNILLNTQDNILQSSW